MSSEIAEWRARGHNQLKCGVHSTDVWWQQAYGRQQIVTGITPHSESQEQGERGVAWQRGRDSA